MFRRFMNGRYGVDQLSIAILVLALFSNVIISFLFESWIGSSISIVLLALCYYRIFSKNCFKRSQENAKFLRYVSPISYRFQRMKRHLKERSVYRFYRCPNCRQQLRVPKGKGKITITCPKCKHRFDKRT